MLCNDWPGTGVNRRVGLPSLGNGFRDLCGLAPLPFSACWSGAGLFMRFFHLDEKPMHADEAVNGVMVHRMLEGEPVTFDPTHYHGPSLHYLGYLSTGLHKVVAGEGLTEVSLRWLTALAGVLGVFTMSLFKRWIGLRASLAALALMAVSPGFIYFSRYFIHEMLFVFLTLVFLVALWRFTEERKLKWGLWTGGLFGFLHATRETAVIVLAAVVLALMAALGKHLRKEAQWILSPSGRKRAGVALLFALGVSAVFYSAFFTHPQGPIDSILTYFRYEIEPGHEKPFFYYMGLILGRWTALGYLGEGSVLLLGLVGLWVAFKPGDRAPHSYARQGRGESGYSFHTFLAVYVLSTTVAYSVIGYKTPWLVLNLLAGWILLAGDWMGLRLRETIRHLDAPWLERPPGSISGPIPLPIPSIGFPLCHSFAQLLCLQPYLPGSPATG